MQPFADDHTNEPRPRPFSPPPVARGFGTVQIVLFVALTVAAIYGMYRWAFEQQVSAPKKQPPAAAASAQKAMPPPEVVQPAPRSAATANARAVGKCVINGKTSYSDQGCPQGATASQLLTDLDHNLIAGLTPSQLNASKLIQDQEPPANSFTAPSNAVLSSEEKCGLIDAEIARLDALARQPQSGQSQDRITQTRKEWRDRQFRIRC
jgi:hypothetical protein